MPSSFDPAAYADCYALLDKALESDQGIQRRYPAYAPAYDLRARLNMARTVDKRMNTKLFEPGDPMYGSSIYMQLRMKIFAEKDGGTTWWVLQLQKVTPDLLLDEGWEEIGKKDDDGSDSDSGVDRSDAGADLAG